MKSVLVVGGEGFIGYNLVTRLASDKKLRVRSFDNGSARKHMPKLPEIDNVAYLRESVERTGILLDAMNGVDTVIHLASNADISKAATEPSTDFWHGTVLTQYVLEAARKAGVKTIIFPSGSGVYGDCGSHVMDEGLPMRPVSPYGASKMSSEALICAYANMFGIRGIVVRLANVVGPYATHGVGLEFMRRLKENPKKLRILGDGNQSKSYVHVSDVIGAMLLLERTQKAGFDTHNVATNQHLTVKQIADMAVAASGLSGVEYEFTGGYGGWKGDVPVIRFSSNKIRDLGWNNKFTSEEAMKDALKSCTISW